MKLVQVWLLIALLCVLALGQEKQKKKEVGEHKEEDKIISVKGIWVFKPDENQQIPEDIRKKLIQVAKSKGVNVTHDDVEKNDLSWLGYGLTFPGYFGYGYGLGYPYYFDETTKKVVKKDEGSKANKEDEQLNWFYGMGFPYYGYGLGYGYGWFDENRDIKKELPLKKQNATEEQKMNWLYGIGYPGIYGLGLGYGLGYGRYWFDEPKMHKNVTDKLITGKEQQKLNWLGGYGLGYGLGGYGFGYGLSYPWFFDESEGMDEDEDSNVEVQGSKHVLKKCDKKCIHICKHYQHKDDPVLQGQKPKYGEKYIKCYRRCFGKCCQKHKKQLDDVNQTTMEMTDEDNN